MLKSSRFSCARFIVALSLLISSGFCSTVLAETPFDGSWQGEIAVPGSPLEIDVDLTSDDAGTLSGDITIPVQGIQDLPLGDFEKDGDKVRFKIPGIPGEPTFDGELSADGQALAGAFLQGGAELTFALDRSTASEDAAAALDGFDAVVEKAIADFNVPGLGIAIVSGGEVVYAKGFGYRNLEEKLPMTPDTLFAIGSTTKAMTATVLAMQAEEGLFDWDAELVRYLPGFRLADPMITARISPRDLVTHRSGLPRHDVLWYNVKDVERADLIERLEHLELTADLREKWQYNNLMFMTAGYLSGQLDGRTWEETMRARLFDPLGMERSNFSVETSKKDDNFAQPYRENDDDELELIPFRNIDVVGPAGSVNSSVNEMARWLAFNLSGGLAGDQRLLSEALLADVHAPHMPTGATPSPESRVSQEAYGMGWGVQVYRGHRRIQHGGGIDGFITSVALYPDDHIGIVTFTNRGSGLSGLVQQTAADRLLGLEPVDWIGQRLARMKAGEEADAESEEKAEKTKVAGTEPSRPLDDYVGDYRHPGYGTVQVTLEDGALTVSLNNIDAPLEHWHYDVFIGGRNEKDPALEEVKVQFRGDFDGQIAELLIPLELAASPIVFSKQAGAELSDPAYLELLTGRYQGTTGQIVTVGLNGSRLTLLVPGQPLYTLVPQPSGRFAIEGLQGFSADFELTDGVVTGANLYQPNGVFEFTPVEP